MFIRSVWCSINLQTILKCLVFLYWYKILRKTCVNVIAKLTMYFILKILNVESKLLYPSTTHKMPALWHKNVNTGNMHKIVLKMFKYIVKFLRCYSAFAFHTTLYKMLEKYRMHSYLLTGIWARVFSVLLNFNKLRWRCSILRL